MEISCPHCGQTYSMTPEQTGQTVQCTNCKQVFTAGPAQSPQQQPGQPLQYGGYSPAANMGQNQTNPLAIVSIVCGGVSIVGCCCFFVSWAPGIAAIITGVIALNQIKQRPAGGRPLALTGIWLGVAGLVLVVIRIVMFALQIAVPMMNHR